MESFPPPKFGGKGQNLIAEWRSFIEEFEVWIVAAGKSEAPDVQKIAMLLLSLGKEYRTVFNHSLIITDDHRKEFEKVKDAFETYFEPQKLVKGYITEFLARKQKEHESVMQYISELRELADKCDFGTHLDDQLCIAISNGVYDPKLREKLWSDDFTLADIIKKCQQWEQRNKIKHLYEHAGDNGQGATASDADVHAVHTRSSRSRTQGQRWDRQTPHDTHRDTHNYGSQSRRGQPHQQQSHHQQGNVIDCGDCGLSHVVRRCPAYGKLCNYCRQPNHFARMCKQKQKGVHFVTDNTDDHSSDSDSDTQVKFVWCNVTGGHGKPNWSVDFDTVNGSHISFKIDTAADVNVMSKSCYDSLKQKPVMYKSDVQICGLGKQVLKPLGVVNVECVHKGERVSLRCEIVDGKVPNLLSLTDSVRLSLVQRVDTVAQQSVSGLPKSVTQCPHESTDKIIQEFSDVFEGIGKVKGEVELKIDPTAIPVAQPPRPVPAALRDAVQAKLQELVDEDIIEKVTLGTPTPWCSALHVVPKKNGTVRLTIDAKDLNNSLQREYHPTNTVEQVAQRCDKKKYFTVLDATKAISRCALMKSQKI